MTTIVVIHTGPVTVDLLKAQFAEQLADARIVNIVDDSLLTDVRSAGRLTARSHAPFIAIWRMPKRSARTSFSIAGASSVGEATDLLRGMIRTPIVKVDEAMADEACALGPRIGVVATVSTTLDSDGSSPDPQKGRRARAIEIRGNGIASRQVHSKRCLRATPRSTTRSSSARSSSLPDQVDVIVLAQVSMARLVPSLGSLPVPVLSSPQSGVASVKRALAAPGTRAAPAPARRTGGRDGRPW